MTNNCRKAKANFQNLGTKISVCYSLCLQVMHEVLLVVSLGCLKALLITFILFYGVNIDGTHKLQGEKNIL